MKLAIIRIRGTVAHAPEVVETLKLLNLNKPNHCVIVNDNPSIRGMIKKVESLITWGPVSDKATKDLQARAHGKCFTLHPPRKGYSRKSIKLPYRLGGAYGDRGEKINELIERMV